MPGQNLFEALATKSQIARSLRQPCVFISHRQADTSAAQAVASYLENIDVDIYLDIYDPGLATATAKGDAETVVKHIETGINYSSHLLGMISPNTKGSWWVPFEIGSARRSKLPVAYILLANVDYLPEYLKITTRILDRTELKHWVEATFSRPIREAAKAVYSTSQTFQDYPKVVLHRLPTFKSVPIVSRCR